MEVPVKEVIGFDLGHGETAVAKAMVPSQADPEVLEIYGEKSQITALGFHRQRGVLIGREARTLPDIKSLEITFKRKPSPDPTYRQTMRRFMEEYYRYLKEQRLIDGNEATCMFVGCPAGWSETDREAYQALLQEAGITRLRVVPESRAAFMHARDAGKLTVGELRATVLIIDIGSSTTDLTLVTNFREAPLDFGHTALGGGLLDQAILARTLASHPQRAALEDAFQRYSFHRARCELLCREAKERYFNQEDAYADPQSQVEATLYRVNQQWLFEPIVNGPIIQTLLEAPLPELGYQSWKEAFRGIVQEVKQRLDQQGTQPAVLLLTGGGSRMRFTWEICEATFPDVRVYRDTEPELCIARGLARVGRWEVRAQAFQEQVRALCEGEEFHELIKARLPDLIARLVDPVVEGLLRQVIAPALQAWRNGRLRTLADLEPHTAALAKIWLNSAEATQQLQGQCIAWLDTVLADLAPPIDHICREFGIPTGIFKLAVSLDVKEVSLKDFTIFTDPALIDRLLVPLVTGVIGVVIATLLGGEGIALLMAGPIGWVIGLLVGLGVGLGVALFGKEKAKEVIAALDIPLLVRRLVLWESRINSQCEEMRPQVKAVVAEQLQRHQEAFDTLIDQVRQLLKEALEARADEVLLLIQ